MTPVRVLGKPLPVSAWARLMSVSVGTAAVRLVYPIAAVLLGRSRPVSAIMLVGCSLVFSLLRAFATDRATRQIRAIAMGTVASAIAHYPIVHASKAPTTEQLESEIARGAPWVESYW